MSKRELSGRLITPQGIIKGRAEYENGIITAIKPDESVKSKSFVAPGFIESWGKISFRRMSKR